MLSPLSFTMSRVNENRRQQIYNQIKEGSKDKYILSEMKRLGFWKTEEEKPTLSEELINQEAELLREYRQLVAKQKNVKDKEAFLKSIRTQKIQESREKQAQNKEKRKQEKLEKAEKWKNFKLREIIYLGQDVSAGLNNKTANKDKLSSNMLPQFTSVNELANAMGITVGELRFLSFSRKNSKVNHYQRFKIKKKSGGTRLISAPKPRLKEIQHWVLINIINKVSMHSAAHGFISPKSIVTNAKDHVNKKVVINMDLKNFFPTITYGRVKGMFFSLGYSEQIATILALICTEPMVSEFEMDDENYFIAQSPRYLPQGAPTSPGISNIICRRLDARIQGLASKKGFIYTRYADDITLSSAKYDSQEVKKLLSAIKSFVKDENFVVHPDKLRVMHSGRRQEVTGITVNKKVNICAKELKRFRALLHHIEKDGLEGKNWKGKTGTEMLASIKGYAEFISMVNPKKGAIFKTKVQAILKKYNWQHTIVHFPKKNTQSKEKERGDSLLTKIVKKIRLNWFKQ